MIGKRIGKLVVEASAGDDLWTCVCDCGAKLEANGYLLMTKRITSCSDCYTGKSRELLLYERTKYHAKKRGLVFELTPEECYDLSQRSCRYCGAKPSNEFRDVYGGLLYYSGLDRIDSNLGYVTGNVVPCCKDCNFAKGRKSVSEFLDWVRRVARHQNL